MNSEDTVEIPVRNLAETAYFLAMESDDIVMELGSRMEENFWESVDGADVVRGIRDAAWEGDAVHMEGTVTVREFVRRHPASGGPPGEPPTNPPEDEFRNTEVYVTLRLYFDDEPSATFSAGY